MESKYGIMESKYGIELEKTAKLWSDSGTTYNGIELSNFFYSEYFQERIEKELKKDNILEYQEVYIGAYESEVGIRFLFGFDVFDNKDFNSVVIEVSLSATACVLSINDLSVVEGDNYLFYDNLYNMFKPFALDIRLD